MLTLDIILKTTKHANSYGETGKHVFGRGSENIDGTFSDEASRLPTATQTATNPAPKQSQEIE